MVVYIASVQRKEDIDGSTWEALLGIYSSLDKVKEHYPTLEKDSQWSWIVPGHP